MLPQAERLKKNSEFSVVYNIRKSVANSLLILYVDKKKESLEIPTKVGFVVGKKINKKAVKRNRIKRLLREAYKNIRKTSKISIQWESLIFIARPKILEVNYKEVYDAVIDCLKKASKKYGCL
ncbi:MAG: ribonuclease P protein component [bacterium]